MEQHDVGTGHLLSEFPSALCAACIWSLPVDESLARRDLELDQSPFARGEQHHIPAKVGALMALLDCLDPSLTATATRFFYTLLAAVLDTAKPSEMEAGE
jgi:hypothetical protein